jgi:hypothetical protein
MAAGRLASRETIPLSRKHHSYVNCLVWISDFELSSGRNHWLGSHGPHRAYSEPNRRPVISRRGKRDWIARVLYLIDKGRVSGYSLQGGVAF